MIGDLLRVYARELLGLTLTEAEASDLIGPLRGIRSLVEQIERVPLPYCEEPFTSPRSSAQWLDRWTT